MEEVRTKRGAKYRERENEQEYAKGLEMEGISDPKLFWELFHIKERLADLESPFERNANWEGEIEELHPYDAVCEIKTHQNEVIYGLCMQMRKLTEQVELLKSELSKVKLKKELTKVM